MRTAWPRTPTRGFRPPKMFCSLCKLDRRSWQRLRIAPPLVIASEEPERARWWPPRWLAAPPRPAASPGGSTYRRRSVYVIARFAFSPLPAARSSRRTGRRALAISRRRNEARVPGKPASLLAQPWTAWTPQPIRGTNESVMEPVFSPDGTWLAYFAGGGRTLKKIPVSGGSPITLAELPAPPNGAIWRNGRIVFGMTSAAASGIYAVPEGGGAISSNWSPSTRLSSVRHNLKCWTMAAMCCSR